MSDKHSTMSEQGIIFGDLLDELRNAFYDMPAPDSESLAWAHVESAKKINAELKELIQFLTP